MTLYAARFAGVRAVVVELLRLFPIALTVDALLAPSHFALNHPSVTKTRDLANSTRVCHSGVDTDLFSPANDGNTSDAVFVIGYIGRLSTEKSVGLLVQAAKYLVQECPVCRIRIIGDGPLKRSLMELARAWQLLGTATTFVDGIYDDPNALVQQLRQMDVYASPCMYETLGLEAVSVGVPFWASLPVAWASIYSMATTGSP